MAEEHRCEAPEGHILCANNCGFFASPTTMNLCSKCFREQESTESTKSTIETALSSTATATANTTTAVEVPSPAPSTSSLPPQPTTAETSAPQPIELASSSSVTVSVTVTANPGAPVRPNRCAECKKRVGLTGFKCRCGVTFCGTHRYPEKHACSFDFKTVGREEIARANPVIKAEKLERI